MSTGVAGVLTALVTMAVVSGYWSRWSCCSTGSHTTPSKSGVGASQSSPLTETPNSLRALAADPTHWG